MSSRVIAAAHDLALYMLELDAADFAGVRGRSDPLPEQALEALRNIKDATAVLRELGNLGRLTAFLLAAGLYQEARARIKREATDPDACDDDAPDEMTH